MILIDDWYSPWYGFQIIIQFLLNNHWVTLKSIKHALFTIKINDWNVLLFNVLMFILGGQCHQWSVSTCEYVFLLSSVVILSQGAVWASIKHWPKPNLLYYEMEVQSKQFHDKQKVVLWNLATQANKSIQEGFVWNVTATEASSIHDLLWLFPQYIWTYKRNLTQDIRFDSAASEVCGSALKEVCNQPIFLVTR